MGVGGGVSEKGEGRFLHRTGILCGAVAWTEGVPHTASGLTFSFILYCEWPWEHGPMSSSRKANNIGRMGGAREEH